MKNSIFARFARAFFISWHFEDVLVLSTTWNDLFCSCVDDESIWWQMFNFVFSCPKRWFQFNSSIVTTHFSSIMSLNNWKMIAETRSHIFRWPSRFRRRRVCLSSLLCDLFRLEQFFGVSFFVLKDLRPSPIGKVLQKKKLVRKSTNELKWREIVRKWSPWMLTILPPLKAAPRHTHWKQWAIVK